MSNWRDPTEKDLGPQNFSDYRRTSSPSLEVKAAWISGILGMIGAMIAGIATIIISPKMRSLLELPRDSTSEEILDNLEKTKKQLVDLHKENEEISRQIEELERSIQLKQEEISENNAEISELLNQLEAIQKEMEQQESSEDSPPLDYTIESPE